ncbi:hypothetical protein HNV10_15105 [Winogradskyella litoriviva]|uniref:Uncharacterized protein n=1 Tax=Winogradskyella litoriviva TaxID=1220182 RepID=A0ABX2EA97_9FLAO|nr:hypothetical protein [Winogradskyella litoriviva]NRD24581.1 hypothetical protein [Winogradskyella litoriviva]
MIPILNFKNLKIYFYFTFFLLLFGCPSEDDCTKTITIPQTYFVGNQSYSNEITQEVPCDYPEPTEPELIEAPVLENFSYEILSFNYEPDTGNNTTLLQYEIQLNNHNSFDVTGFPIITIYDGNFEYSGNLSADADEPCNEISANSSCILSMNKEYEIEPGILPLDTYQIVNVEYLAINQ